jgi:hypothetical protein
MNFWPDPVSGDILPDELQIEILVIDLFILRSTM